MELELDIELDKAKAGFLLLGIILGVGTTIGYSQLSTGDTASNQLVNFLENQSGQNLELVNNEKTNQFYKVEVRTPQNQLSTYYTNGELFTANMQNMEEIRRQKNQLASFQTCLSNSNIVMFGNATQQATQSQIQALGGTQVVSPIYQDVSNNQTLRQAAQLGIQQVPAFYRNQSAIQGIQTLEQVEQFTGCTLQTK